MPFAPFNSTNPRTNPWNFQNFSFRIGDFEKCTFFESAILKFFFGKKKIFLLNFYQNTWKFIGWQGIFEILMITLVYSQKSVPPNISACSVHTLFPYSSFTPLYFKVINWSCSSERDHKHTILSHPLSSLSRQSFFQVEFIIHSATICQTRTNKMLQWESLLYG